MPALATAQKISPVELRGLIQPDTSLSAHTAQQILDLGFSSVEMERMNVLASKAREGELNEAEAAEIEEFNRLGHLLGMAHSKARKSLKAPVA